MRATGDNAGEVGIFTWDGITMEFALVQTTGSRDQNPVDASFFSLSTSGEPDRYFPNPRSCTELTILNYDP